MESQIIIVIVIKFILEIFSGFMYTLTKWLKCIINVYNVYGIDSLYSKNTNLYLLCAAVIALVV